MYGVEAKLVIAHLTASPFLGGPERQMIGLARAMGSSVESVFLCFMENGKATPFVHELEKHKIAAVQLKANFPHLLAAAREVAQRIRDCGAHVLLTHGYKPDIIGWMAARIARIPIVMVSRGWTYATWRVRLYEKIDRLMLHLADRVVCVSEGQARKVRAAGVRDERIEVIHNSIDLSRFSSPSSAGAQMLKLLVPPEVRHTVMAIGRLSPEKGFDLLIKAARKVLSRRDDVGFVIVGDGPLKRELQAQINAAKLQRQVILAGFREDVDMLLPHASLLVQTSHTEGMPNAVLEAMAAGVPVVATSVGGTPELIVHGESGHLVDAGDVDGIAEGILTLLGDSMERARMTCAARHRVEERFTFASQAAAYEQMLGKLLAGLRAIPERMEMASA